MVYGAINSISGTVHLKRAQHESFRESIEYHGSCTSAVRLHKLLSTVPRVGMCIALTANFPTYLKRLNIFSIFSLTECMLYYSYIDINTRFRCV